MPPTAAPAAAPPRAPVPAPALVVAFGGLTGHGTGDRADPTTDHGARPGHRRPCRPLRHPARRRRRRAPRCRALRSRARCRRRRSRRSVVVRSRSLRVSSYIVQPPGPVKGRLDPVGSRASGVVDVRSRTLGSRCRGARHRRAAPVLQSPRTCGSRRPRRSSSRRTTAASSAGVGRARRGPVVLGRLDERAPDPPIEVGLDHRRMDITVPRDGGRIAQPIGRVAHRRRDVAARPGCRSRRAPATAGRGRRGRCRPRSGSPWL